MTCKPLSTAGSTHWVKESLMSTSVKVHWFGLEFTTYFQKDLTLEVALIQMVGIFSKSSSKTSLPSSLLCLHCFLHQLTNQTTQKNHSTASEILAQ